jgi:hypothetical protein
MKVTIVRGGGIGGFTTRTDLDDASLNEPERSVFARQLEGAIDVSPSVSVPARPDEFQYEITLDAAKTIRTLRFSEAELPEAVRGLVNWVDGRPERTTALEQPA